MAVEQFKVDNVAIASPDSYKPVFSTTSTSDSDRDQSLDMHNTPIGTIAGYDMTWGILTNQEISTILNGMMNKSKFLFHHPDPTAGTWSNKYFYATDFSMEGQDIVTIGEEIWKGLSISVRRIDAIK